VEGDSLCKTAYSTSAYELPSSISIIIKFHIGYIAETKADTICR